MVKKRTCLLCNYSFCTNICSSLNQTDPVPTWCALCVNRHTPNLRLRPVDKKFQDQPQSLASSNFDINFNI